MSDELTEEQARELVRELNEGKQNLHKFFTKIIQSNDTTKTGNLTIEELGMPNLPARTNKELALFCEDVFPHSKWKEFFEKKSEILTSTSLSKDGLLVKLSVTQKKESSLRDDTPRKENKGWFKKKDDGEGGV
jgi:hypothetical protein